MDCSAGILPAVTRASCPPQTQAGRLRASRRDGGATRCRRRHKKSLVTLPTDGEPLDFGNWVCQHLSGKIKYIDGEQELSSSTAQIESESRTDNARVPVPAESQPSAKPAAPETTGAPKNSDKRGLLRRVPRKAYLIGLLLVLAIALFTWRFTLLGETATLRLKVQHSFKSADIAVFVDGESRYSGKLSGTSKRRFGFRNNAEGTFSHTLHLHPGRHLVRVQVKSPADGYSETNEMMVEIGPDKERQLTVTADRRSATLRMSAQTTESAATAAAPTWYQSYFTSLSLTLSGTVVSMLFGYLIQQFVGLFRKTPPIS